MCIIYILISVLCDTKKNKYRVGCISAATTKIHFNYVIQITHFITYGSMETQNIQHKSLYYFHTLLKI